MSLDILKKKIKEEPFFGVYLFCGPEEYTKDHYASMIRKKVDSSPLPEFNHIYFNASTDKISDLEDAIYSLPYMWETKLIEITDLESAKISESDIAEYTRLFSDIPEYLVILAVLRYDQTDDVSNTKTSKNASKLFIEAVKENGLVVEFETEKSDKLITWINRHFNAKGIVVESNVPREILNICGSDMYILQSEVLKLSEVYSGVPLTVFDVRKFCCANSSYKYFDIVNALNQRDLVKAKRILDSLGLGRDEISVAIGYLAKNYSDMLMVKSALDSGKGFDTISRELKIPQWRVGKISSSVAQLDSSALNFAITQISNVDIRIKSFAGDPRKMLEFAFYRICTYGNKA